MLEKLMRATRLIEVYSGLLTEKQAQMCSLYYLDNLSLSEIAENMGVSRQAVHDSIERAKETLERADAALGIINKEDRITELCESLKVAVSEMRPSIGNERHSRLSSIVEAINEEIPFGGK